MKRFVLVVVLTALALAATLGYASSRREQAYHRLIEQGDAALVQGESFAAVEAFTVAIALKPGSMLGYLKRGEAYRQYGELETALKDLHTASGLDPAATRPLELLGDVEHALRRYDRAAKRFEKYLQIDDQSPRILYKLALSKYHDGDAEGAIDALRTALTLDAHFAQAHYLMGLCFESLDKSDQARRSLQRAVELSPALLDARAQLADLHRRASRSDERLSELEALQALDPGSPSRHVTLAMAHAEIGQFDRAVTILGRAVARFPAHPYSYVALGRVWLDAWQVRGDDIALQKAVEALERAATSEGSSEALMLLGRALLLSNQAARAATVLLDATDRKPLDPLAFYYLADAAERIGNVPVARNALLDYHALEGDPADPRRRSRLFERIGRLSAAMDDSATAVTWFGRAAAADPGQVDAAFLVRFADAQWKTGDPAGARDSLTKALALEPGHRGARALLRRLPPGPAPPAADRF
jgi:tetratricopeptide (TPR) repeat protein